MFERFTDRARRTLVLAQEHARAAGAAEITGVHLLLALAHDDEGMAGRVLAAAGVDVAAVRDQFPGVGTVDIHEAMPFSKEMKKVLELSLREALQLGHNYIGTEHMLLALLRLGGPVAEWLVDRGVNRADLVAALPGEPRARRRVYPRRTGRVTEMPTPYETTKEQASAAAALGVDESADELLALVAEEGSAAQQALAALGVDAASLADAVRKVAADSTSADGRVVLDLDEGVTVTVEPGERARQLRVLLRPLVEKGVVTGHIGDDATFHAHMPGMRETVTLSITAWLEAAAETAG